MGWRSFEETVLAVEFLRIVVILALVVYGFIAFQSAGIKPFAIFLAALAVYGVVLDLVPRLLAFIGKPVLLKMFLPAFGAVRIIASPLLVLSRHLLAREEHSELPPGWSRPILMVDTERQQHGRDVRVFSSLSEGMHDAPVLDC